jgi:hypothetical protein
MSPRRRAIATALVGATLAIYFSLVVVHLMPMNPIKLRLDPLVNRCIQPYFAQSWELFAPNPVLDTRSLLVSCRLRNRDGATTETPWSDMTAPLRQLKNRYHFSPADRLERMHDGAIHMAFPADDRIMKVVRAHSDSDELNKVVRDYDSAQRARHDQALRILSRIGSAECDRLYGEGASQAVRVRMILIDAIPFSRRYEKPTDKAGYLDFDWTPYERVSPI